MTVAPAASGSAASPARRSPRAPDRTTRRRYLAAALVVVAGVLGTAMPAGAHTEVPGVTTVVDGTDPALPPATDVAVRDGRVTVAPPPGQAVQVLDRVGTPFLRLGQGGVDVDLSHPAGRAAAPDAGGTSSPTGWVHVSDVPTWTWADDRLDPSPVLVEPAGAAGGAVIRLDSWTLPLVVDGRPTTVHGHREYRRPDGRVVVEVDAASVPVGLQVAVAGRALPTTQLDVTLPSVEVLVLGATDEPMLRFTSAGVEANEASPTWSARAGGRAEGDRGAEPRWRRLAARPSFAWDDPRHVVDADVLTPAVIGGGRLTTLAAWAIPVVVGGHRAALTGTLRWEPTRTDAATHPARRAPDRRPGLGTLACVAAAALVTAAWRRRRHRPDRSARPAQ